MKTPLIAITKMAGDCQDSSGIYNCLPPDAAMQTTGRRGPYRQLALTLMN